MKEMYQEFRKAENFFKNRDEFRNTGFEEYSLTCRVRDFELARGLSDFPCRYQNGLHCKI